MRNPSAPYPGRELFVGLTTDGSPALAYLVTGRSPQSRERLARPAEDGVIIGPIGNAPYDPLRHYTGVKYDNNSKVAAVSNGIQTQAIFEAYRLLFNTEGSTDKSYLEYLLQGAGAEPDSLHTPRIAAAITFKKDGAPVFIAGIKTSAQAAAFQVEPASGLMYGVSTYKGDMDKPEAYDPAAGLLKLEIAGKTAEEIARFLYDISAASHQGDDIRVCSVGGVYSAANKTWNIAIVNRHK
jgi:IMP cyclohydrolase